MGSCDGPISEMDFIVIEGDIARQRADALVSAADTTLAMSGGSARALGDGGGDALHEAAVEAGPVDPGEVAVTDAFGLAADAVIHAAAKPAGGVATDETVRKATRRALNEAESYGCRSIVLPALGCGVGGMDLTNGARIIAEELDRFESTTLTDIRLIAYTASNRETLQVAADDVRLESG